MEPIKEKDFLPSGSPPESNPADVNILPLEVFQKIDLEILLEELGEIIESEDGLLTP